MAPPPFALVLRPRATTLRSRGAADEGTALHYKVTVRFYCTVLRGAEIRKTNPISYRPSGFSSVTADAVMRVATSAGANRELAVRHPHQCRRPTRRGTEKHVFGQYWATRDASHLTVLVG